MKSENMMAGQRAGAAAYILLVVSCILHGAPAAGDTITLGKAVANAIDRNPAYKISLEKAAESRLKVRETWGKLWPDLSTDASYMRQGADEGLDSLTNGAYDIRFIRGSIAVNPGELYNSLQASRKGHVAAVTDARRVKADIIMRTIRLYYQVLLSAEVIKLRSDSIRALEENFRVVSAGYQQGSFRQLDYLRAKVALANERTRLILAENDHQNARAALSIDMGMEINEGPDPEEAAITIDARELAGTRAIIDDEKNILARMTAGALKNRPEILQLSLKKEAAEYRSGAAESVYLCPSLFVTGSYGTTKLIPNPAKENIATGNPLVDQVFAALSGTLTPTGWYNNWRVTFGATYRWGALSPADASHARDKQYESQAAQAGLETEELTREVKLEVQGGFLKLKSAYSGLISQEGNIETAREAVRVSLLQFRSGAIDNTKLLEANTELATARTFYIQSLTDYQTAKAEINRAVGSDYFTF